MHLTTLMRFQFLITTIFLLLIENHVRLKNTQHSFNSLPHLTFLSNFIGYSALIGSSRLLCLRTPFVNNIRVQPVELPLFFKSTEILTLRLPKEIFPYYNYFKCGIGFQTLMNKSKRFENMCTHP